MSSQRERVPCQHYWNVLQKYRSLVHHNLNQLPGAWQAWMTALFSEGQVSQVLRLKCNDCASSPVITDAVQLGGMATQMFTHAFSHSLFGQSNSFHTYALIIGIAYFPVLVSIAPFVLGSFTSLMKLLGIPVLLFSLGTDSTFLSW